MAEDALVSVFVTRSEVLDAVEFDGRCRVFSKYPAHVYRHILDGHNPRKSLPNPGFRRALQVDNQGAMHPRREVIPIDE